MNKTTKSQREQWQARASELIRLEPDGTCPNREAVKRQLQEEYGISYQSAQTAVIHAIMKARYKIMRQRGG